MQTQAHFNNTTVIGMFPQGPRGMVNITKMNAKSFHYSGEVAILDANPSSQRTGRVTGKAVFWKMSKDGTKAYYKGANGAVLTLEV